jgi:hypothetical protein
MVKSVEGIYRNGKVELVEPLAEAEGSRVIVTWVHPAEPVDLRERGIDEPSVESTAAGRVLVTCAPEMRLRPHLQASTVFPFLIFEALHSGRCRIDEIFVSPGIGPLDREPVRKISQLAGPVQDVPSFIRRSIPPIVFSRMIADGYYARLLSSKPSAELQLSPPASVDHRSGMRQRVDSPPTSRFWRQCSQKDLERWSRTILRHNVLCFGCVLVAYESAFQD